MSLSSIAAIVLLVVGLGLTLSGLVNAVRTTRRDIRAAGTRVLTLERLGEQMALESEAMNEDLEKQKASDVDRLGREFTGPENVAWQHDVVTPARKQLAAKQDKEYARHELRPPTYENAGAEGLFESQWLLNRILDSNQLNLWLLGGGICLQTAAAIWSLFK